MAESLTYPHIDFENTAFSQPNATTSTNLQNQFADEHRAGAWIRDSSTTTRSASVHYSSQRAKYVVTKKSDNGVTVSVAQSEFDTLSAAADDGAAYVDSENTAS